MRAAPPSRPPFERLRSPPSAPGAWRGDGRGRVGGPALPRSAAAGRREGGSGERRAGRGGGGGGSEGHGGAGAAAAGELRVRSAPLRLGGAPPVSPRPPRAAGPALWVLPVPRGRARSRLVPGAFCGRSEGGTGVVPPARCDTAKRQTWFWFPAAFGYVISKEGLPRMSGMR